MARVKYITTQVTEEIWIAITEVANLRGDSISKTTDSLVQRGLAHLEQERGSSTPVYVRLARIEEQLKMQESREQRLMNSYNTAIKLEDTKAIEEIHSLAQKMGIKLAEIQP